MPDKSIEARVAEIERKQKQHDKIISSLGLNKDFVALPQAAILLEVNPQVLYRWIRKPGIKLNKHFKMNGNRYLINIQEYRAFENAEASAKLA